MQKYDPGSIKSERAENGIPSISTKASQIIIARDDCGMQIVNFLSEYLDSKYIYSIYNTILWIIRKYDPNRINGDRAANHGIPSISNDGSKIVKARDFRG